MSTGAPVIVWFREDLRLADHPSLTAALQTGRKLLPLYVLDETGPWPWGAASRWWLHGSLAALAADLGKHGARLTLRRGDPTQIVPDLADQLGAEIHTARAHMPQSRAANGALAARLGARFHQHRSMTLFDLDAITTKTGGIYGVYTPFARAVRARTDVGDGLPAPARIPTAPPQPSDRLEDWALLPTKPDWAGGLRDAWSPGEAAAHARLHAFLDNALARYKTGRNLPGEDGTSRLSPHLHWGELSARQVWHAARALPPGDGLDTFLGEILWREFAAYLLWHHPALPDAPLRPAYADLPFRDDPTYLAAWQRGRTGIPIVDAGLRQLWHTGWMHNRVRMITASFLVKNLLIDWRVGERWFWDTLVDADLATNAASWQWIAGSGTDSQPFFRVFNPVTQSETWDEAGEYVARWVPELRGLPGRFRHSPWTASTEVLRSAGVVLGTTYPKPIVDLAQSRQRALDTYRQTVRKAAE